MRIPWWKRERADEELDEELASHLRMATADRVARGEAPDEARHAARREFGNVGHIAEVTRDNWGGAWIDRLRQDVRYAARSLRRSAGFTAAAILTLALGIGSTTAVFSLVNGVLLRPLPFPNPEELFVISYQSGRSSAGTMPSMDDRNYLAFRERTRTFQRVATFDIQTLTLTRAGDPKRLRTARVTPDLVPVLGVTPAIGRSFRTEEGDPGAAPVVMISDGLWRDRFGADASVLGRTISIDDVPHTVVGVMRPGFDFPQNAEAWIPLAVLPGEHSVHARPMVGRLATDASPRQAQAELDAITPQLATFPGTRRDSWRARVIPLHDTLVGDVTRPMWVFAGAVGFVLLVACVNIANLLLLRGATREQELAVRATLGASRKRLLRQLLTESTVLSLAGGALGVLLASIGVRALLALAPAGRIPRIEAAHIDGWVLAFSVCLSTLVGLLIGSLPALRATGSLGRIHSNSTRSLTARWGVLPGVLVVSEIAVTLVLLTGAGLMIRSYIRMREVRLGFDPTNVLALTLDLPAQRYSTTAQMADFHGQMLSRLEAVPGVDAAGLVNWRPLGSMRIAGDFWPENGRKVPPNFRPDKLVVSDGYFGTMGIRLLQGRDFSPADDARGMKTAVISGSVARAVWTGMSPLGQRITLEERPGPDEWLTVVGVVDDIVQETVVNPARPAIYLPYPQVGRANWLGRLGVTYLVRASDGVGNVAAAMRDVMREVDANLAPLAIAPMDDLVASTIAEPLFQARLLGAFAILGVLLASVGVYGVLAYSVAVRRSEIGIRMALGARAGSVLANVVLRSFTLAAIGAAFGIAGALMVTRALSTMLYGVTPTDPLTLGSVAVLLCGIAVGAGLGPALRASRVDPASVLKGE